MKRKFKNSILAIGAIVVLSAFGSCSNGEDFGGDAGEGKTKTVKVRISTPSTYAAETSAEDVAPALDGDVYMFFIGGGIVRMAEVADAGLLETTGKTVSDIPSTVTKLVIIGNSEGVALEGGLDGITPGSLESALNEIMFVQANQGATGSDNVNVYGYYDFIDNEEPDEITVPVYPAVSRIEIGEVKANAGADQKLTTFKLAGIYINNTYAKLGTDYLTLPDALSTLAYSSTDPVWSSPTGTYSDRYCDEYTGLAEADSFTPGSINIPGDGSDAGKFWSYYVLPVRAGNGTTINIEGVDREQTSVPHIILKIEDVDDEDDVLSPGTAYYVTITQLQVDGEFITELEKGGFYQIEEIAIGGENLSLTPEPGESDEVVELVVKATVIPWNKKETTPKIPGTEL
jgi:hypothetical protein